MRVSSNGPKAIVKWSLAVVITIVLSSGTLFAEDVPYVPTPDPVVDKMMEMARVKPGDYVIDLGSGDGRLVIEAAKRGAIGHGIEIDPNRIIEAQTNALKEGVTDRVVFVKGDIFEANFSEASVITLYLLPKINRKLGPELLDQLDPGTRIVSHNYGIGNWQPREKVTLRDESLNGPHEVYYWVVPARVDGDWTWTHKNRRFRMKLVQDYGEVEASLKDNNGTEYSVEESSVSGARLQVRATNGDTDFLMNGKVEGDRITGSIQVHSDVTTGGVASWDARRK